MGAAGLAGEEATVAAGSFVTLAVAGATGPLAGGDTLGAAGWPVASFVSGSAPAGAPNAMIRAKQGTMLFGWTIIALLDGKFREKFPLGGQTDAESGQCRPAASFRAIITTCGLSTSITACL